MTTNRENSEQLLVPAREAALMLSISERTLYTMTAPRGPINPVHIGKRVLYSPATLRAFAEGKVDADLTDLIRLWTDLTTSDRQAIVKSIEQLALATKA